MIISTPSNPKQPQAEPKRFQATSGFNLTVLRYRLPPKCWTCVIFVALWDWCGKLRSSLARSPNWPNQPTAKLDRVRNSFVYNYLLEKDRSGSSKTEYHLDHKYVRKLERSFIIQRVFLLNKQSNIDQKISKSCLIFFMPLYIHCEP